MENDVIEAITKLLDVLFKFLSPGTVVFLIIFIPAILFIYKIYTDWAKRHEVNATIKAKDETIQILNEHNRQLRVLELKMRGWSENDIDAVIMKETPKDPIEGRNMIQESKRKAMKRSSKDGQGDKV